MEKDLKCPRCREERIRKAGLNQYKKQRYKCGGCGHKCDEETVHETKNIDLTDDEIQVVMLFRKMKRIDSSDETQYDRETITIKSSTCITEKDFIDKYDIDMRVMECIRFEAGAHETAMKLKFNSKNTEGHGINATLPVRIEQIRSSAVFKPIDGIVDIDRFRRGMRDFLRKTTKTVERFKYPKIPQGEGNLFMPNIYDLHLGKLCWHEEGGENYDLKIAQKRMNAGMNGIISQAMPYNIDRILFPVGHDFFNYDKAYPFPQTTAGTPMESDVRWQKMFQTGINLLVRQIEKLSAIAPVQVVVIPGNHDTQTSFYLGEVLDAYFMNNENVSVDNSPKVRKYFVYGTNLIGMGHGQHEKAKELHQLMSTEARDMWSKSRYMYFYLGHMHHYVKHHFESAQDYNCMIAEYLSTPAPKDEYEHSHGYHSINTIYGMIHSQKDGRKASFMHNF